MSNWRNTAREAWHELRGGARILLLAWVLLQLSMPFTQMIWGDSALYPSVVISVLLQAATSLAILVRLWPTRRLVISIVVVLLSAWALEAVGSSTGFPFGHYHYTDHLQPQLLHVPLLIPIAWLMMLPPAWAVASLTCSACKGTRSILIAAFGFTAWDLFLDPQMVHWNLWVWDEPGAYFGIPLQNYFGWLIGSLLITIIVRPFPLRSRGLLLVYTLTWLLETVGLALFWGQPGPALCGFLAMGIFVLLGWWRLGEDS